MRYQSTVLGQLLKVVPRGRFERIAERHRQGRAKRQLSDWGHLVAMVLAHLSGAASLRDLERFLERHRGALAHLGLSAVRRSTLADANARRPAAMFEAMAAALAGELAGGRQALRLIDATRVLAGKRIEDWSGTGGVKLHLVYDSEGGRPVYFAVTPERVNDITVARAMPIEGGATYVFDKGYYAFAFWARLAAAGCRFVTRLKINTPVTVCEQRAVPQQGGVLGDCVATLPQRLAGARRNPYDKPLRIIAVRLDTGRVITLVSNDLASSADDIAALYKQRWQVELFFKWIKQNLSLTRFLGTSRNAVTIQIMAALIAFLVLRLAQVRYRFNLSLAAARSIIARVVLQPRPLADLLALPPHQPPQSSLQLDIPWPKA